jgi:hypothetical protein
MTFGPVPTNGTDSIDDTTGVGPNSPENYAGATGSVDAGGSPPSVPLSSPPALLLMLVLSGALGALLLESRPARSTR